ncbi:MAG: T9SS type A sorting domain-containing protein, partial [Flavobacteriales bacterium]
LLVFPNPAEDLLNITTDADLSNSVVSVFDVAGQRVLTTTLRNGQLDISALNSGLYLLQVQGQNGTQQRKFTKR